MRSVNVWFQVDQYISFLRVIIKILKSCGFYFIGLCISAALVDWVGLPPFHWLWPFLAIPIAFLIFKIVGWDPEGDAGE